MLTVNKVLKYSVLFLSFISAPIQILPEIESKAYSQLDDNQQVR